MTVIVRTALRRRPSLRAVLALLRWGVLLIAAFAIGQAVIAGQPAAAATLAVVVGVLAARPLLDKGLRWATTHAADAPAVSAGTGAEFTAAVTAIASTRGNRRASRA